MLAAEHPKFRNHRGENISRAFFSTTAVLCEHPSIQNGATVTVQYGRGKQQETATTLENHAGEVFHWKPPYLFFDIPEGCGFHRRI